MLDTAAAAARLATVWPTPVVVVAGPPRRPSLWAVAAEEKGSASGWRWPTRVAVVRDTELPLQSFLFFLRILSLHFFPFWSFFVSLKANKNSSPLCFFSSDPIVVRVFLFLIYFFW